MYIKIAELQLGKQLNVVELFKQIKLKGNNQQMQIFLTKYSDKGKLLINCQCDII